MLLSLAGTPLGIDNLFYNRQPPKEYKNKIQKTEIFMFDANTCIKHLG